MKELPCLKLLKERFYNSIKEKIQKEDFESKKYYPDFNFYVFPQTWGDTSLGFGGIGGQMITSAYTTVIIDNNSEYCGVFFSEKLAYIIKNPNDLFYEDIHNHEMKPLYQKSLYIKK